MEIDLNHEMGDFEKNPCKCNGNCEKGVSQFCCLSSNKSSSQNSSGCSINNNNSSSSPPVVCCSSLYMELWHACAGPLTSLPKKGSVVVYFPQGHLEQQASVSSSHFSSMEMPNLDLQSQIFCRVLNVQLLANKENDEVYAQLALLPQLEMIGMDLGGKQLEELGLEANEERNGGSPTKSTPHMFCKTLTASDTSTHGGFSVPRRAAEDCFPPLDYSLQRPSQELTAKDLHGVEWQFRHIYRGQPRRHLLTTGWSIFVSQKNLVCGDAVLFLRGENGELRLGIRRAVRPRNGLPDSIVGKQNVSSNLLSPVANAVRTKNMFHVFYSPRASHADFIIPYQKYIKSISNPTPIGTRFSMRVGSDDSPERRCSGIVTGIGDSDPYRWRNLRWRSLMVRWDDDIMNDRQERVSPWEIDPSTSLPTMSIQSSPRMKKLRTTQHATPPENPTPGGDGFLDFEGSLRSSKVLQGQENLGFVSPFYGRDQVNRPLDFDRRSMADQSLSGIEKANLGQVMKTHPTTYTGFVESNKFPEVLQGQEICPLRSFPGNTTATIAEAWMKPNIYSNVLKTYPAPNFYPLASEGARTMFFPYNDIFKGGQEHPTFSSPNAFQGKNLLFNQGAVHSDGKVPDKKLPINLSMFADIEPSKKTHEDANFNVSVPSCKLFGFSLTGENNNNKRSCTKVHKQGSLVGRAVDLSRLGGYDDLLVELERLFSMEGLLKDPEKGWRILYTDSESDTMVVGDDPWRDFCNVAMKIHIYTREEVEKMTRGVAAIDDNQSCLEEAPGVMEVSKSSSDGQPDSSPTIISV